MVEVRVLVSLLLVALLGGCATAPAVPRPDALLHDEKFAAPTEAIDAGRIFAMSEPMRRYLDEDIAYQLRTRGPHAGLIEALFSKDQLRLDYDAAVTRTASEAFAARSGNCLSLVIMTAAFAKALDLRVVYRSAYLEEAWSRSGGLLLRSGHVNVTLVPRLGDDHYKSATTLTVDFLPAAQLRGLRTEEIDEQTIVAMYMNNRAAEALVQGRVDDAYAWAREALLRHPAYLASYNTLGIVYLRREMPDSAERVFRHLLAIEPRNTQAIANLAETLARLGRPAEATALRRQLALLEPVAPFHHLQLGVAALRRDDARAARDHFARELARDAYSAETHYWMGVASQRLGDHADASRHLALALEYSATGGERERYGAKLRWLKAQATR